MSVAFNTLESLVDRQAVAFIGSVDAEGFPNMKAMLAPRVREGLKVFYFTTNTSSMRAAQYRRNPKAAVYFCDGASFEGLMLRGTMEVLEDAASRRLIWLASPIIAKRSAPAATARSMVSRVAARSRPW